LATTQYKNDRIDTYTTVDTAPDRYQTLTGTISTNGIFVTGVGTLFTTEIGGGDIQPPMTATKVFQDRSWLFDGTEVRRITAVVDDTHLTLEEAFTTPLVAVAVKFVRASRAMQMSYLALTAGGIVDGNTLIASEFGGFGLASDGTVCVDPIVIDGTGGSVRVNKFYFH